MSTAVVKAGRSSWVGSSKPSAVHDQPPRLRASASASYGFLRSRNPVPPGDTVASASLQVIVASGAAGSVTFTLKRVTQRVTWDELTWNNRPSVTSTGSASVTVSAPADGTVLTFDVTTLMQAIAGGSDNYGWRLEATSAVKVYGYDSANPPVLTVVSTTGPATPTDLRPAGIGSLAKPWLTVTAPDVTGEAEVQSVQAQLSTSSSPAADSSGTWTSPTFDSGEVAATTPDLNLASTAYAGLASGSTIYWHFRWKSGGVWSPWSDTVAYTRQTWGTLTVTNPSGGVVEEPTPPIIFTYSAIRRYRVQIVLASDNTKVIASTNGPRDGGDLATASWTPSKPLQDSTNYVALVDIWGVTARTSSPGDPDFLRATVPFTTTFVGTVTAPVLSTVDQSGTLPLTRLTFTRTTAPDSFAILRDDVVIAADLDPADLLVSGTTYAWTDTALGEHTYKVAAVVNGQRSAWSNAVTGTVLSDFVWLITTDLATSVRLGGREIGDWSVEDGSAVFRVLGQRNQVQIRPTTGSLAGSFTGGLEAYVGKTYAQVKAAAEAIFGLDASVLLVVGDYCSPVRLRNTAILPHSTATDSRQRSLAKFSFIEAS